MGLILPDEASVPRSKGGLLVEFAAFAVELIERVAQRARKKKATFRP